VIEQAMFQKEKIDYMFVISDMIMAPHKLHPAGSVVSSKIQQYRDAVNPDLQFVCIDLFGHGSNTVGLNEDFGGMEHPKDHLVTGYSDQILSYIVNRNEPDAQVKHVERIYEELTSKAKKGAKESKEEAMAQ